MDDRSNVLIHFHNPVGMHEISADTLLIFVEAYKEIAKQFGLVVELNLTIPEEGGWKVNVVVWIISFIGVSPFLILFTGESVEYWAKKGHTEAIAAVERYITKRVDEIEPFQPRECLEHKNKIYRQLHKDKCVTGFKLGRSPVISKDDFHLYIAALPDEYAIYLGVTKISVFSPDWRRRRSWRGRIEILSDQEKSFDFDYNSTSQFWDLVNRDQLILHTTDVMHVQLIELPTRRVKHRVVRVLMHNETEIDVPLSVNDISSVFHLSEIETIEETVPQMDLFEDQS